MWDRLWHASVGVAPGHSEERHVAGRGANPRTWPSRVRLEAEFGTNTPSCKSVMASGRGLEKRDGSLSKQKIP